MEYEPIASNILPSLHDICLEDNKWEKIRNQIVIKNFNLEESRKFKIEPSEIHFEGVQPSLAQNEETKKYSEFTLVNESDSNYQFWIQIKQNDVLAVSFKPSSGVIPKGKRETINVEVSSYVGFTANQVAEVIIDPVQQNIALIKLNQLTKRVKALEESSDNKDMGYVRLVVKGEGNFYINPSHFKNVRIVAEQNELLQGLTWWGNWHNTELLCHNVSVEPLSMYKELSSIINFASQNSFRNARLATYYGCSKLEKGEFSYLTEDLSVFGKPIRDSIINIHKNAEYRCTLIYEITKAIEYLHSKGIVHGSMQPGNIYEDASGRTIKIANYGVAPIALPIHYYTAPELLASRTQRATKKSDIYSLGVIMYELFSRADIARIPPLVTMNDQEQLNYLKEGGRYDLKRSYIRNIPETLSQLIQQCWSQHPEDRPTIEHVDSVISGLLNTSISEAKDPEQDQRLLPEIGWAGDLTREEAVLLLSKEKDKTFLFRWSKNIMGYVLSYNVKNGANMSVNHINGIEIKSDRKIVVTTTKGHSTYNSMMDYIATMRKNGFIGDAYSSQRCVTSYALWSNY